jgi:hypothetical protein
VDSAALTLIAEKRYGVKVIGTVTMPVAIVGVILMQLCLAKSARSFRRCNPPGCTCT